MHSSHAFTNIKSNATRQIYKTNPKNCLKTRKMKIANSKLYVTLRQMKGKPVKINKYTITTLQLVYYIYCSGKSLLCRHLPYESTGMYFWRSLTYSSLSDGAPQSLWTYSTGARFSNLLSRDLVSVSTTYRVSYTTKLNKARSGVNYIQFDVKNRSYI